MTEIEARKELVELVKDDKRIRAEEYEALQKAIFALEEIQKYRAIGTVEESAVIHMKLDSEEDIKKLKEIQLDSSCILHIEKAKTNADKIRAMSDEELAEIIMCPAEFNSVEKHCMEVDMNNVTESNCIECCLKWLQSESNV